MNFIKFLALAGALLVVSLIAGIAFRIQFLIFIPVIFLTLMTCSIFINVQVLTRLIPAAENYARPIGGLSLWLLSILFLIAYKPDFFYGGPEHIQIIAIYTIAAAFLSFFLIYIGSKSHLVSYILAGVLLLVVGVYTLTLFLPSVQGLFGSGFSLATTAENAATYQPGPQGNFVPSDQVRAGLAVAILEKTPRVSGGEELVHCMLPNEAGDYIGGREFWIPRRKLRLGAEAGGREPQTRPASAPATQAPSGIPAVPLEQSTPRRAAPAYTPAPGAVRPRGQAGYPPAVPPGRPTPDRPRPTRGGAVNRMRDSFQQINGVDVQTVPNR